jgi:hypothetical protein
MVQHMCAVKKTTGILQKIEFRLDC